MLSNSLFLMKTGGEKNQMLLRKNNLSIHIAGRNSLDLKFCIWKNLVSNDGADIFNTGDLRQVI